MRSDAQNPGAPPMLFHGKTIDAEALTAWLVQKIVDRTVRKLREKNAKATEASSSAPSIYPPAPGPASGGHRQREV
jgi:hypothetical protein